MTVSISDPSEAALDEKVGDKDAQQLREDVELIEGVYGELNVADYQAGKTAPVFFGSAINNFGVKELLDTFIRIAPTPQPRETTTREVLPDEDRLSGFVFKIHANLDPKHRDRIAFLRVCSGRFERTNTTTTLDWIAMCDSAIPILSLPVRKM